MAGFANISAASQLQQAAWVGTSLRAFGVVAVNILVLLALFSVSRCYRTTLPEPEEPKQDRTNSRTMMASVKECKEKKGCALDFDCWVKEPKVAPRSSSSRQAPSVRKEA